MDSSYIIPILVVSFIIFLIVREFWCWYFKINERKKLLEEILAELKKMNNESEQDSEVGENYNNFKKTHKKKNENKELNEEDDEEEINPDEPVEDPFWNKKR